MLRVHAFGYCVGDETWSFNTVYTETLRAMIRMGYDVSIHHGTEEFRHHLRQIPVASKQRGWAFACGCPDTLEIMPMARRSYYCYWGEHHFRPSHVAKMNTLDRVFVNSTFSKRLLQESGAQVPIELLRPGINPTLHTPSDRMYGDKKVHFLFVGQQWRRKGLDLLAQAWKDFAKLPAVELTIKLSPHNSADLAKVNELFAGSTNVTVRMEQLSKEGLAELYREHDVFLFPSRSEGFGIPVLEALACGLLPIATNYGGYLDFCTPENAVLVPVERLSPRDDGMDTGEWANADVGALREAILTVSRMDLNAGKHARANSVAGYTYDAEATRLKNLFTLL